MDDRSDALSSVSDTPNSKCTSLRCIIFATGHIKKTTLDPPLSEPHPIKAFRFLLSFRYVFSTPRARPRWHIACLVSGSNGHRWLGYRTAEAR
jgi:hypothetical protein